MSVNDQIKELQTEFRKNGLNLYLQGEGESPSMHEMDKYLKSDPIKFPIGSADILPPLQDALNQKRSAMLMKNGNFWDLFIESPKKEGGCFIATAVFGSEDAFEVEFLRNFRDNTLLSSLPGKWFVNIYYAVSPPIASWISDREAIKAIFRTYVLRPLITFLTRYGGK